VDRLVESAVVSKASFVVVTGGEPTIHDLTSLTTALRARKMPVHLETIGAFPFKGEFDWVTLSPKWTRLPLLENLARADELKLIIENGESIASWWDKIGSAVHARHVWLHPEWSQRENPAVLRSISNWVKLHGDPFRAGFQTHRLYNVDALDERSRPPIPLGGNSQLGY
jgi:organic radical activating enzyme